MKNISIFFGRALGLSLFQRWLFQSLFLWTLASSGILTFLIWSVQSLRFLRMASYQGLSFEALRDLCLSGLPRMMSLSVPLGFFCVLLWSYNRLLQDNERNVMSASGVTSWFFVWPSALLSLCISGALLFISIVIAPQMITVGKQREHMVRYYLDPSFITPGIFFRLNDYVLYTHKQKSQNVFEGIFIYEGRHAEKETFFTGQLAKMEPKDHGLMVSIMKGTMQSFEKDKPPLIVHFDEQVVFICPKEKTTRNVHLHELSVRELLEIYHEGIIYRKELINRLFLPCMPFVMGLWVPALLLSARRRLIAGFIAALSTFCLYFLLFFTYWGLWVAMMALMSTVWLCQRLWRNS